MSKIMIALSGGVDSSVAMLLLKQQGFDISACYMKTWMNEEGSKEFLLADCPWHQDIENAQACADLLGVKFQSVDFIKEYKQQIVEYLIEGYKMGLTPNPDIMCNAKMKFGKFLDFAKANGFDKVATGHYCSKKENEDGSADIIMGADPSKDQSYFLTMINQNQLQSAIFPIGNMLKSQVRDLAIMNNLPNAMRKDSQGICFLGKVKIQDFLQHYLPQSSGDIRNPHGDLLGKHKGLFNYTIGQRKGIGIPSNTDFKSYVVVSKDFSTNTLIIDFDNSELLYSNSSTICNINWINKPITQATKLSARVRYRDDLVDVLFTPISDSTAKIEFAQKQRAIAKGQVLALYNNNTLLGGGFFGVS